MVSQCIDLNKLAHLSLFLLLFFFISDLLPVNEKSAAETQEFLSTVVGICLDFIVKSNDRKEKVLEFHQPSDLRNLYDFSIPSDPLTVDQLLKDCSECLKYQVKTGESSDDNQNESCI